jgi:hypothetical protein
MDKIKAEVSGYLTLETLREYIGDKHGLNLYLAVHGSNALVKLDVKVISLTPQYEGSELRDAELDCELKDGRFFKLLAASMMPPRLPPMPNSQEPVNYSRMFSSEQARDVYFDGLAYTFEIEEERYMLAAKKRNEQFLTWFVRRMGGPEKES